MEGSVTREYGTRASFNQGCVTLNRLARIDRLGRTGGMVVWVFAGTKPAVTGSIGLSGELKIGPERSVGDGLLKETMFS